MGLGMGQVNDDYRMGLTSSGSAQSNWQRGPLAVWGQGYADKERRDSHVGFVDGRRSHGGGFIGGIDATLYNVFGSQASMIVGVLTGYQQTHSRSVDTVTSSVFEGYTVGVYGVYSLHGFSIDANAKVDFVDVEQTSPALSYKADQRNFATGGNLNYRFELAKFWFEPTVGVIYTDSNWDSQRSNLDLKQFRVQGGARVGTSFKMGSVTVEPTLTALLYSDVMMAYQTQPASPIDRGEVFQQAIGKLNFDLGKGLSSSVEGEVRHGTPHGAEVLGASGRVGVRYQW